MNKLTIERMKMGTGWLNAYIAFRFGFLTKSEFLKNNTWQESWLEEKRIDVINLFCQIISMNDMNINNSIVIGNCYRVTLTVNSSNETILIFDLLSEITSEENEPLLQEVTHSFTMSTRI